MLQTCRSCWYFSPCLVFQVCIRTEAALERSAFDADVPIGSPLDVLLKTLNEGRGPHDRRYAHKVCVVDSSCWLEGSRARVYILCAHTDLVNASGILESAAAFVEGCQERCQTSQPVPLADLLYPADDRFLAEQLASREARPRFRTGTFWLDLLTGHMLHFKKSEQDSAASQMILC